MYNFVFHNPTTILFGKEQIEKIDQYIPENARVMITYGGGSVTRNGVLARSKKALGKRTVIEFGGIEPNPHYETLMKAVEIIRTKKVDFLLAVGGGSVIDGTKFIALATFYTKDATDLLYYGFRDITPDIVARVLPFGAVLTLPATGSEMNNGAVVSYNRGKYPIKSERTYPQFSVLEPEATYSLPHTQVANGVVDAFVHVGEQYLTFPVDARIQDRTAEGIMQTLIEVGPLSIAEPQNYDARANLVWAATMALNGLIGAGVPQDWATHMIGHELTALFGIDHGKTLAIVYPALLSVRSTQKFEKLTQYAERVWGIKEGSDREKVDLAIARTRSFFESLGIPTRLSEYGLDSSAIDQVVAQLEAHGMLKLSETGDLTPEVARSILQVAY